MTFLQAVGTVLASFGVSLAASLSPVGGGVEVYLLATSALLPSAFVAPLVVASAAGSVAAKTLVFMGTSKAVGTPRFLEKGGRRAALAARIQEGPWIRRSMILLSATLSLPPYYALAVVTGALRTSRTEFIVLGLIGQSLRFTAVWAIPQLGWTLWG